MFICTNKYDKTEIMLIEFNITNHRSFKDIAILSMEASSIKDLNSQAVFEECGRKHLKLAVLYGANGSGKSNLLDSIVLMRSLVIDSSRESQAEDPLNVEPYLLDNNSLDEPTSFEVLFIIDKVQYRYGFEVYMEKITSEWLFETKKKKEIALFFRNEDKIEYVDAFNEGERLENKTRPNALFLSVVAQFNGEISSKIVSWFRNINPVHGVRDQDYFSLSVNMLKEKKTRDIMLKFMKAADLGITDMHLVESDPKIDMDKLSKILNDEHLKKFKAFVGDSKKKKIAEIVTMHNVYDENGDIVSEAEFSLVKHESSGTNKLFNIIGAIVRTLISGEILIIDELNARLHPLLTREIVKAFNSSESNPNNAQLIFTTHDTNLLDISILRRDQIYFTEKDKYGASHLYSLVEYKPRNDEALEKNYISGKYGAIPFVGGIRDLLNRSIIE